MANQKLWRGMTNNDSVRDLQRKLNSVGYNLDVDGAFGNLTYNAVRDYQTKNNLAVDGVVGDETWGHLNNAVQNAQKPASTTTTTTTNTLRGVSADTSAKLAGYEQGYKPSEAVTAAQKYLQDQQAAKPGAYESPYAAQLQEMYDRIVDRKPFSYDLNNDMLYRQYRDQYMNLGQLSMQDAMGQAAGLTGGYGSTYSQNAGQQAYQQYLQQLNDRIPELYDRALAAYNAEGDEMKEQYALLNDRENTAYGRYRDTLGDWRDDLARADQQYQTERGFDYGEYSDMLNYYRQKAAQENSDYWTQTQYDYQRERDAVADDQWAKQYALSQAAAARAAASYYSDNDAQQTEEGNKISELQYALRRAGADIAITGKLDSATEAALKRAGYTDADTAYTQLVLGFGGKGGKQKLEDGTYTTANNNAAISAVQFIQNGSAAVKKIFNTIRNDAVSWVAKIDIIESALNQGKITETEASGLMTYLGA